MPTAYFYLDIETLPNDASPGVTFGTAPGWTPPRFLEPPRRTVPASYTRPDTIDRWNRDEDARHAAEGAAARATWGDSDRAAAWTAWTRRALSPMTGRIACIGYAIGDSPAEVITGDEDDMLHDLASAFARAHASSNGAVQTVGHNIDAFDGPYLVLRAALHGIAGIAPYLRSHTGRASDAPTVDTMDRWPCGTRPGKAPGSASLDAIAAFLSIDRSANPISGAHVLDAYLTGREDQIIAHCHDDIRVLRNIHQWMCRARLC